MKTSTMIKEKHLFYPRWSHDITALLTCAETHLVAHRASVIPHSWLMLPGNKAEKWKHYFGI